MGMGVKVRVWGSYALFSRPEMKVERCSYDVMTPSAATGDSGSYLLASWYATGSLTKFM